MDAHSSDPPSTQIDRDIYVMPQFATFTVSDLDAASQWYVDGLGFVVLATMHDPAGTAQLVHLRRFRYQDILLVPGGDARDTGDAGIHVSIAAGPENLEARARTARGVDGGSVDGPTRTAWNTRDVTFHDDDGHEVVFTAPVAIDDMDPALAERLKASMSDSEPAG